MPGFGIDRYGPISLLRPRQGRAHTVLVSDTDQVLGPWASETVVIGITASGGDVFYQGGGASQSSSGSNAHFLAQSIPLMINIGVAGSQDRHQYLAVRKVNSGDTVNFYVTEFE